MLISLLPAASAAAAPNPSAASAVVMTGDGQLLYEKSGTSRALIASTTKLMTAIVTLENTQLNELVDIKPEYCNIEGSSMYLKEGERYTVRELLLGLLLVSGNDAACALACHTAGSTENFVRLMNRKAEELGMTGSSFANPHGLDAKGHYSTALDMAKLMCYCMKNESFRQICGVRSCNIQGQTLVNHNRLLELCEGCVGGKTGYTLSAGRCLVSCCERKGLRLICVTLSAPDDWNDHVALYEWAYSRFTLQDVMEGQCFSVPVISGNVESVNLVPEKCIVVYTGNGQKISLRAELPRFVFAPVNRGETGGQIWVIINGKIIDGCRLIYVEGAELAVGDKNRDGR
ncbi:MAG: D-alanyl-D-alanine carboxypeptidase family protein [Candidatus Limivicinus sp.]